MAATIILLVILILFLLFIAVFSVNLNVVISFFASTKEPALYKYAVAVRIDSAIRPLAFELYRTTNESPKKQKKKKRKKKPSRIGKAIRKNLAKYRPYIEIHALSYRGQIAFGSADHTAFAAGALQSAAGIFTAYLSTLASKTELRRIDIRPVYNNAISLDFLFECIVKGNIGNIIIRTLNILKGSKKHVKSHKRRHVNRNEQHQRDGGCQYRDRRRCANA